MQAFTPVCFSDNRPAKQMLDMFMDLTARIEVQLARLKPILNEGLPEIQ